MEDVFLADRVLAVKFRGVGDCFVWSLAIVYGPNVYSERSDFLDILSTVNSQWSIPWVFGGDFNIFKFPFEKKGGNLHFSCYAIIF